MKVSLLKQPKICLKGKKFGPQLLQKELLLACLGFLVGIEY